MSAVHAGVSVRDALDGAVTAITASGSQTPRLDAELLLADAMATTREQLFREPAATVEGDAVRTFQAHVRRRAREREPLAYIVGRRAFRRLELTVDARVLVPRPETELVVELALAVLAPGAAVLDCCCGGGAIALALADERPDLRVWGSDLDAGALTVARANAGRLGLTVSFHQADLLEGLRESFDAIVANPPYVESATIASLAPEVARHEPRLALDGGANGLGVLSRLLEQASRTPARVVILEHGEGQGAALAELCRGVGYGEVEHHRDLAGISRVVVARR